ncbi:MAG: GNAT family N-acetyltransferase [Xanthomonadaceae bacterium]|nr:GNAT family N-acetyltransferase [Xanthomonadaceae bacterium]MDE1962396.1 GNAT family N-acetyltransferase [Xanthomonadaceae bacterium]
MSGPRVLGSTASAPLLETPRLRLRPHRVDDLDALHALWSDPAVYGRIGGQPPTRQEVWFRLLRYGGLWPMLGYGFWAIEDKATGTFAGDLGYADFQRAIEPPLDGLPEVGWAVAPAFHGRGYASEALAAVTAWGDAHFGAHRDVCIISPDNAASIRVAEKGGFSHRHDAVFNGAVIGVYIRDASVPGPR